MDRRSKNDWESQPRDPETGRFWRRAANWEKRSELLQIRLTPTERRLIEDAARRNDTSITAWAVDAMKRAAERQNPAPPDVSEHQRMLARRLKNRRF